jgi:hypothetical protein
VWGFTFGGQTGFTNSIYHQYMYNNPGGGPSYVCGGGSLQIHPGVSADFTAFVVNPLSRPVTLISASVVPVAATRPTGRLGHVAVGLTHNIVANFHGWPVPQFPIRALADAVSARARATLSARASRTRFRKRSKGWLVNPRNWSGASDRA